MTRTRRTAISGLFLFVLLCGAAMPMPASAQGVVQEKKPFFLNLFKKDNNAGTLQGGILMPKTQPGAKAKTGISDPDYFLPEEEKIRRNRAAKDAKIKAVTDKVYADNKARAAARLAKRRQIAQALAQQQQQRGGIPVSTQAGQQPIANGQVPVQQQPQQPTFVYDDPAKKPSGPKPVFGISR